MYTKLLVPVAIVYMAIIPVGTLAEPSEPPSTIDVEALLQPTSQTLQEPIVETARPVQTTKKKYTPKPVGDSVEQWRSEVSKYDWPVEQALAIIKCESGGNPNSKSRTDDHGLFQIHKGYTWYGDEIYNPQFNIAIAYKFYYAKRGWQPWSCRHKLGLI